MRSWQGHGQRWSVDCRGRIENADRHSPGVWIPRCSSPMRRVSFNATERKYQKNHTERDRRCPDPVGSLERADTNRRTSDERDRACRDKTGCGGAENSHLNLELRFSSVVYKNNRLNNVCHPKFPVGNRISCSRDDARNATSRSEAQRPGDRDGIVLSSSRRESIGANQRKW